MRSESLRRSSTLAHESFDSFSGSGTPSRQMSPMPYESIREMSPGVMLSESLRMTHLGSDASQCAKVHSLDIELSEPWGKTSFIGLTGIELLDEENRVLDLSDASIQVYPKLSSHGGLSFREAIDNLFFRENMSTSSSCMCLLPYSSQAVRPRIHVPLPVLFSSDRLEAVALAPRTPHLQLQQESPRVLPRYQVHPHFHQQPLAWSRRVSSLPSRKTESICGKLLASTSSTTRSSSPSLLPRLFSSCSPIPSSTIARRRKPFRTRTISVPRILAGRCSRSSCCRHGATSPSSDWTTSSCWTPTACSITSM